MKSEDDVRLILEWVKKETKQLDRYDETRKRVDIQIQTLEWVLGEREDLPGQEPD